MKGRAEEYSQKYKDRENFNDWFVNIFWFQNKWKVFAVAVIIVVVGFLLIDALRQVNYDTSIVIAARNNIDDDELVEVTPKIVRLRKRYLDPHERKRQSRASE